jgi:hypothetical protein
MTIQILWNPHDGKCSQCGFLSPNIRMFMSEKSITDLCKDCWFLFVLECNIPLGLWEDQVLGDWDIDTDMILTSDTTQQDLMTDMAIQSIKKDQVSLRV